MLKDTRYEFSLEAGVFAPNLVLLRCGNFAVCGLVFFIFGILSIESMIIRDVFCRRCITSLLRILLSPTGGCVIQTIHVKRFFALLYISGTTQKGHLSPKLHPPTFLSLSVIAFVFVANRFLPAVLPQAPVCCLPGRSVVNRYRCSLGTNIRELPSSLVALPASAQLRARPSAPSGKRAF